MERRTEPWQQYRFSCTGTTPAIATAYPSPINGWHASDPNSEEPAWAFSSGNSRTWSTTMSSTCMTQQTLAAVALPSWTMSSTNWTLFGCTGTPTAYGTVDSSHRAEKFPTNCISSRKQSGVRVRGVLRLDRLAACHSFVTPPSSVSGQPQLDEHLTSVMTRLGLYRNPGSGKAIYVAPRSLNSLIALYRRLRQIAHHGNP